MTSDFVLPPGNRLGPNCGVTAIAVLAGVPFDTVWNLVAPTKPHNWKGSLRFEDTARALRLLKVRYRSRHYGRKLNVRAFVTSRAKRGVFYLIDTLDHLAVLKDGVLLDQRGHFTIAEKGHWLIERAYEVAG